MSTRIKERPLDELTRLARSVLQLNVPQSYKLYEMLIKVAEAHYLQPNRAIIVAQNKMDRLPHGEKLPVDKILELSRAVRVLSMVRLYHGEEAFNRVVGLRKRPRAIVAEATATVNPNPRAAQGGEG